MVSELLIMNFGYDEFTTAKFILLREDGRMAKVHENVTLSNTTKQAKMNNSK